MRQRVLGTANVKGSGRFIVLLRVQFPALFAVMVLLLWKTRCELAKCSRVARTVHRGATENALTTSVCLCIFVFTMKRYAVFLKHEQIAKLNKLFVETGVRPAEAIRRAIDAYLTKKAKS